MFRRLLPAFVALGVGLIALAWGLVTLQRMFAEENEAAKAQLTSQRRAVAQRAADELRALYASTLRESIRTASPDPLERDPRALWVHSGHMELPSMVRPRAVDEAPVMHGFKNGEACGLGWAILSGQVPDGDLQQHLLREASELSQPDFDFLASKILERSHEHREPTERFVKALHELETGVPVLPSRFAGPTLFRQTWYVEPVTPDDDRGIEAPLDQMLSEVSRRLRAEGVLSADDRLSVEVDPVQRMNLLEVNADLRLVGLAEAELARRYGLKNAMVIVCGLLAIALTVFGILGQRRKERFLELKSDFVATVSHELRTPLASIRLLAETLERSGTGAFDETIKQFPGRIVRVADGLHFLVENILSFNQVTKGRWVAEPKVLRLDALVDDLRADLTDASAKPVHLSLTGDDLELFADPALMRLLFINLGRNACAYNDRPSVEISVRAERDVAGSVTLRFIDNGIGIAGDEWENVFHDFYRLKPSGTEVHGSGLGLALCRRILRLHGGRITIESSSPRGTTFALTFAGPKRA